MNSFPVNKFRAVRKIAEPDCAKNVLRQIGGAHAGSIRNKVHRIIRGIRVPLVPQPRIIIRPTSRVFTSKGLGIEGGFICAIPHANLLR
ncbi:unannotated protein [freshwater metagenome]|uniref:Unannotated protein n=1 Tax=freshwater metagenome TaxID=449393 RepID=A0A6J6IR81_9ZZZZ